MGLWESGQHPWRKAGGWDGMGCLGFVFLPQRDDLPAAEFLMAPRGRSLTCQVEQRALGSDSSRLRGRLFLPQ